MSNTIPTPSFLDNVPSPTNFQQPTYKFLVDELFIKLEGANYKQNLGNFSTMTEKKIHIIESFMRSFKTHIGSDFYPISKLIFPDKSGRLYFIRAFTLARLIIKMYNIPKESEDYSVLFHWKEEYQTTKRFTTDVNNLRDLPLRISRIIANRRDSEFKQELDNYTVEDINIQLDLLNDAKKAEEQIEIMKPLLDNLSIPEVRWFLHIVLKKSILKSFEHVMFETWHPQGWQLFKVCNNLEKTFHYLSDSAIVLTPSQLNIQPMYKFRPQLSFKLLQDYQKLITDMSINIAMDENFQGLFNSLNLRRGNFFIEEKMDGDRMLLHKKGKFFKFYSRRLKDYSFLYGENYEFGSLTKYLNDAFPAKIDSIILDGEMVAWDYQRNVILPFGTLRSSAIQESVRQYTTIDQYEQQSSYPFFLVFDILHINGMNLTNHPLFFRKNILTQVINPVPHRLEVLPFKVASTTDEIQNSIKEVISIRSEGIMVKHIQSKYYPGERNPHWIKIKPEYLEKFGENLDLTVIGRIPGVKNAYMCGLKNSIDQSFYSFCTVGNGFTNEEYDKIERITHGKWIKYNKSTEPPSNIIKFGSKKPIEWIHPRDSLVLEIKARCVDNASETTYAAGSTLHNLYCRGIREDKSIHDCSTIEEYHRIKLKYSKDIEKSQYANKKRRKQLQQDSFNTLDQARTKKIKVESDLFKSFQFVMVSDKVNANGDRISRDELIILVKKYGGVILQSINNPPNPRDPIVIITEKDLPSCQGYYEKGLDLIKPNWIFECINRQQIVPLEPMFLFKSRNMDKFKREKQDQFGDSYIIHTEIDLSKQEGFKKLNYEELNDNKQDFKLDLIELGIDIPKSFLFDDINCYVVGAGTDIMGVDKLKNRIEKYGGRISTDYLTSSFIIAYENEEETEEGNQLLKTTLNQISKSIGENVRFDKTTSIMTKIPNIVTKYFIEACIERNVIVDADDYKYI